MEFLKTFVSFVLFGFDLCLMFVLATWVLNVLNVTSKVTDYVRLPGNKLLDTIRPYSTKMDWAPVMMVAVIMIVQRLLTHLLAL